MSGRHEQGGPVETRPPAPPPDRRRAGRWLRRIGASALATVVALTGLSLIVNVVTRPPRLLDPGSGAYVQVGSSAVHYETWGTRGTPVVLLPGFLESSTVWYAVGPLLGADHIVYALDLPGHGYTRYDGPLLLHSQAGLVDGFVRALHLRQPILVGHSLGAAVAGAVALTYPRDVGKVVFADGDGLKLNLGPRWLRALIVDSPYLTTAVRLGSRWTSVDKWFIRMTCGPHCPTPSAALARQWVRPLHQRTDERALRDLMLDGDYGLTPAQISAISVPSAIIWGSDDHQGGSLPDTIVNLHHPPLHTIGGAGHLTMVADPVAFARAVES